jgi:hypothetical protein
MFLLSLSEWDEKSVGELFIDSSGHPGRGRDMMTFEKP